MNQSDAYRRRNITKNSETDNIRSESKLFNEETKTSSRSCKRYCIMALIFFMPFFIIPIFPFLRFGHLLRANYIKLPQSPKFEGSLKENNLLQNPVYFAKGKIQGPETVLFINDTMYSGLSNGQIVRIDREGNPEKIVRIGPGSEEKCRGPFLETRKDCGRPLGLRYKSPNYIYLADAYHGIFKVDVFKKEKTLLVDANDKRFGNKPLKFTDDLDLDDDGNIYFSDFSSEKEVNEALESLIEGTAKGRLIRFNEKTNEIDVLLDNLYCANGIQLTPNKDAVIVAETCMSTLIKYYIKGPKKGQKEVFLELPGFPDNIRMTVHKTLLVSFAAVRNPNSYKSSILDLFGEYPLIRSIMGSILNVNLIYTYLAPKYGLVVEYDFNGKMLRSWHDATGKFVECATCATLYKNKLYIGSFYADYIVVVDYLKFI